MGGQNDRRGESKAVRVLGTTGILLVGFLLGAACAVSLPEDSVFACQSNADCGGDGFVCAPGGFCCEPVEELCDGQDNDCDGTVDEDPTDLGECYPGDEATRGVGVCGPGAESCEAGEKVCNGAVVPTEEKCNNLDDDCDGTKDEDFDFQTDENNCGGCAAKCLPGKSCVEGSCPLTNEVNCGDGKDDDQDTTTDCADSDCNNKACGTGCACDAGVKKETQCFGLADEDGDGNADCADPDCNSQLCQPAPTGYTCSTSQCLCNGGTPSIESPDGGVGASPATCWDNLDNDCDGLRDCAEDVCNGVLCPETDGGVDGGCYCSGATKRESDCGDFNGNFPRDNDGDGLANCGDFQDCPLNAACRYKQGVNFVNGTCRANRTCQ